MHGNNPHFGFKKYLYKLQKQLLGVAGPFICLWTDFLKKEARTSPEDHLLLVQQALLLLISASHGISLERRKNIRINLKLKSLASKDYEEGHQFVWPWLHRKGLLANSSRQDHGKGSRS